MSPPRRMLRDDDSGVSEVIGTILILGMTVALFAAIIVWVASIPPPPTSVRLEVDGQLLPLKDSSGNWAGVNVTITHRGGESLDYIATRVYLRITKLSGAFTTEILRTKGTIAWGPNAGAPYGLIDGNDKTWNINERWSITNKTVLATDKIRADIVDISRSLALWSEEILGPVGSHPPLFLDKWADGDPATVAIETPKTGIQFVIYAKVTDEDGNLKGVNGTMTIFYGTPDPCKLPQKMFDDGTNGDAVSADGIWTLKRECMVPQNLTWDGTFVLFSATDGTFVTTSRMTLHVVPGSGGQCTTCGQNTSGRPPNLRYNGLQGYNIFNSSQWDTLEFLAKDTRTFKGNEKVIVVVGSYILRDATGRDYFNLYDPFAGSGAKSVVYGTNKIPNPATKPSNLQAFRFYKNVNGYNLFIYRFDLNNASSSGINYYRSPSHPPNYWFARYALTIDLTDSQGTRFNTSDSVNITDTDGYMRQFPLIEAYSDSAYTLKSNTFRSTEKVYIAVSMFSLDASTDTVTFGGVTVRDFLGAVQIFKQFVNGRDANGPLCNPNSYCGTAPPHALVANPGTVTYRFMLNLSLADGDPWVDGPQNYALSISYIDDADESYSGLSFQLLITAPVFRLDVVGGNSDTTGPAWGTHDYGYYYENLNAVDKWRKSRFEFCGLPGTGQCKNAETHAVQFLDGDNDGDLDIASSLRLDNANSEINYYRRQVDFDGNVVFTKFTLTALTGGPYCNDLAVADLTGDGLPEIVCGMTDGRLVYFKNDGSWTTGSPSAFIVVDSTRASAIWGVTIADFDRDGDKDIAVARIGGTVTYYLNLDGLGTFSTGAITDRWFVEAERTITGNAPAPPNDFLRTIASDDQREGVQEALKTEPAQSGNTTNPGLNTTATPWTYADWENGGSASGAYQATGGNPGGLVFVQTNFLASQTVSGFWYQSFTVSGSTPYTATVNFDRKVSLFGASTVTIYVFVDPTNGNPSVPTAFAQFTHTATTNPPWVSSGTISVPASRLPTPGTYYLKIASRATNGATGSTTTVQFDNLYLNWSSTGGSASELEHYWRMQVMPNRPLSTFAMRFEAQRSAPTDGDFFSVAYSIDVSGADPTTGTYTTILWVNTTADLAQNFNFPVNLQNKVVWLRVLDTDHHVGNVSLDTVSVDQIYIDVTTSAIQPGNSITLPSTPGDSEAIDSDDQDSDGFADVVVGTSLGKVYKLVGFAGGLQTPSSCYYPSGCATTTAITGIKLANITTSSSGLDIAISYGTFVRVLSGSGTTGSSVFVLTPALSATSTTLSAGDVDGDGDDDIVVATVLGSPAIVYYRNLSPTTGTSWKNYNIEPVPVGTTIAMWDIDLGDGSKSQYLGR